MRYSHLHNNNFSLANCSSFCKDNTFTCARKSKLLLEPNKCKLNLLCHDRSVINGAKNPILYDDCVITTNCVTVSRQFHSIEHFILKNFYDKYKLNCSTKTDLLKLKVQIVVYFVFSTSLLVCISFLDVLKEANLARPSMEFKNSDSNSTNPSASMHEDIDRVTTPDQGTHPAPSPTASEKSSGRSSRSSTSNATAASLATAAASVNVRNTRSKDNPEFVAKQKSFMAKIQAASSEPLMGDMKDSPSHSPSRSNTPERSGAKRKREAPASSVSTNSVKKRQKSKTEESDVSSNVSNNKVFLSYIILLHC